MTTLDKVRIDKWLWAVRICKTRTLATDLCKSGKVKINDASVKPSYLLSRDEIVHVKKEGINYQYKVVDLYAKRVGAPIAQTCYENITPEDELNKYKDWYRVSPQQGIRDRGTGRPTKKERREIDKYKDFL